MTQTFTSNDLIRMIYKETSPAETLAIKAAIGVDDLLAAEYEDLMVGYQMLPKVKFRPTDASIQNVLKFSSMTALEAH